MGCRASRVALPPPGTLTLFMGCMFAGKTTELIRTLQDCRHRGLRILFVKARLDTRAGAVCIATHDKVRIEAPVFECARLSEAVELYGDKVDVFGIDEVHFFEDAPEAIAKMTAKRCRVYATALNALYDRQMPKIVHTLIGHGATVQHLFATCLDCHNRTATVSLLRNASKYGADAAKQPLIGGSDKFFVCCAPCQDIDIQTAVRSRV
jgi:thymidine kinase